MGDTLCECIDALEEQLKHMKLLNCRITDLSINKMHEAATVIESGIELAKHELEEEL